ncbi:hypothetical protein FOXYSP1_19455 [Fusarium oxysporum f. sp. phaseoli]
MSHETPLDFAYKWPMHCVECDILTRWQWKIRGSQNQSIVETYDSHSLDASGSLRCQKCASSLRPSHAQAMLENYQIRSAVPLQPIVRNVSSENSVKSGSNVSKRLSSHALAYPANRR